MKNHLLSALLLVAGLGLAETAAAQTQVFVQWPLKRNASDSAAVRSTGVTPGTPMLRRYFISNGQVPTGAAAFAPYSSVGQAFGVNADGSGWSSTAPSMGPGGSPRRGFSEQFSFTATSAVQVDSILFSAAVVSSANGKVAVAYSRSNFVSDSTDITGGKGPTGVLPSTGNATFGLSSTGGTVNTAVNGAVVPQYVAGAPSSATTFRLALNGATGLAVPSGQTLSVRLYFGVASTGVGRYVLLRNVTLKSRQVALAARSAVQTNLAVYPNPAQNQLNVPHTAASRDARVTVFSTTGSKVAAFVAQAGSTETAVDLSALPKGLYLVEYADGTQRSSARIVKE
ncbi:T9SS type A sorting domain-containing protein [Hymenobacter monticola]|uniref:T9SS type A sorting domain-containing protein n=1 Tax=Hymenobacter monticola TaxID=1705399 RepID=A0ABY4B9G7_9BACT|nr:T9SS type A sorting domain-containing protein [Hymenobacter monticola]UOE35808.1 T9SS type A sorting domain-containing protein [Hymenobacter monticola]